MAMVVKNNMSAVRTLGTLNKNSAALAKSLEKVSSGQKINSAADDASGYSISERMRVMIRSLNQADENTKNGLSMMKVAEGAVSSTVDILKTMKEKAINAANDSNTDSDRATIQKELDQSIDQIDDNALITYNGKTLVDGSKMAKGIATKTALTNQSLSEDTTGITKMVDLADRNGNRLNIQTSDSVTVSYVIQGRNYTFDVSMDANKTLEDVLFEAIEPYTRESPLMAGHYSTYYSSCNAAQSTYGAAKASAISTYNSTESSAVSTYNATFDTATTTYTQAVADANGSTTTYNHTGMTLSEAMSAAAADVSTQTIAYNGQSNFLSAHPSTNTAFWTSYYATNFISYDDYSTMLSGTSTRLSQNTSSYNAFSTRLSTLTSTAASTRDNTISTAAATRDADIATAATARDTAIAAASTVLSTALSTALSTLGDNLGEVVPYKLNVDTGNVVGKAATGDTVYTANMEKGITITAAGTGLSGQLSGITFSVRDSKGQVKKSVNAVLDNFSETVRALNKSEDNAITLQVGTKANQSIKIGLTDMRSEALGLKGSDGFTLSISNQKSANAAINVLDNAIQKALDQQTNIGAIEARLEMTSANLITASENVQFSESTIRDADMAREMTEYTKNNILLQAAQSMLAQANQSSSNVLSLLQ